MARTNTRSRTSRNSDWGITDMVRERPIAAAAAAAGAAAAGLFLWSKRTQISDQLSNLSDQIGEWKQGILSESTDEFGISDDTAGLTTPNPTSTRSTKSRSRSTSRAQSQPTS